MIILIRLLAALLLASAPYAFAGANDLMGAGQRFNRSRGEELRLPEDEYTDQTKDELRAEDDYSSQTSEELRLPERRGVCVQGYVWREAFPGDKVCVRPQTRAQAGHDNRFAASRVQPGGGPYGPDTCRQGFVWREASPNDHVCVPPVVRSQTARDNKQASMHTR
jgi:hypothetical protein